MPNINVEQELWFTRMTQILMHDREGGPSGGHWVGIGPPAEIFCWDGEYIVFAVEFGLGVSDWKMLKRCRFVDRWLERFEGFTFALVEQMRSEWDVETWRCDIEPQRINGQWVRGKLCQL